MRISAGELPETFLSNHARALVACDFFVAVTATFRLFYVLVLIEHGSRRLVYFNITPHPTAAWTLQLRRRLQNLLHDRDSILVPDLEAATRIIADHSLTPTCHEPVSCLEPHDR